MNFKSFMTETWYHGRSNMSTSFSLDYVGGENALDQEGPGFYFTSSKEDARRYATNGLILTCKINYRKTKLCKTRGVPSITVIRRLIKNSPDMSDVLTNFDENPEIAFRDAINTYSKNDSPVDAYQTIANDFYRGNGKQYLLNIGYFYDGHIASWNQGNVTHLIIYKPEIITVVDKEQIR